MIAAKASVIEVNSTIIVNNKLFIDGQFF